MSNLKKKIHVGKPQEVIDASNTFADIEGISIKASQHSNYLDSNGELCLVIVDFYSETTQQ